MGWSFAKKGENPLKQATERIRGTGGASGEKMAQNFEKLYEEAREAGMTSSRALKHAETQYERQVEKMSKEYNEKVGEQAREQLTKKAIQKKAEKNILKGGHRSKKEIDISRHNARKKYGNQYIENLVKNGKSRAEAEKIALEEAEKFHWNTIGINDKNTAESWLTEAEKKSIEAEIARRSADLSNRIIDNAAQGIGSSEEALARYARMYGNRGLIPRSGQIVSNLFENKAIRYGLPLAGIGLGTYAAVTGLSGDNSPSTSTLKKKEEPNLNYLWTPKGWQKRDANGQWVDQQEEFGVDRYGNTNYYDAETGLWYSDYIQDSDGSVYDRNGNLLGNVAPRLKGLNIFDYNANQIALTLRAKDILEGDLTVDKIKALQQQLGLTADGIVGARTMNALAKQLATKGEKPNYFTIYK